MIKKIITRILIVCVVLCAGAALIWHLNGARWQNEYAAFRKTGAPILMYHAISDEEGDQWPKSLIIKPAVFEIGRAHV